MNNNKVYFAVVQVCERLRPTQYIPNPATRYISSKGNMAFNAYKYVRTLPQETEVYVDQNIAPYVAYTNEPWISPRWHGKKNPNEGWWQRHADRFAQDLANKLGGKLE